MGAAAVNAPEKGVAALRIVVGAGHCIAKPRGRVWGRPVQNGPAEAVGGACDKDVAARMRRLVEVKGHFEPLTVGRLWVLVDEDCGSVG